MENTELTAPGPGNDSTQGQGLVRDFELEQKNRRREAVWRAFVELRGERYAGCRLSNYEITCEPQQKVFDQVQDYCTSINENITAGKNVIALGPSGTGKDHLMTAICYAAIGSYRKLIWINGTSLWVAMRNAMSERSPDDWDYRCLPYDSFDARPGRTERKIIENLSGVDVLAISDPVPPGGPLTDYQAATLFTIIDNRYSAMRPTLLTINVATRAEMEQRIGVPTVDRLAQDALVLACNWKSHRQRGAK